MNTKLILVEGIPGSGKTTTAKKIYEELKRRGTPCRLYQEGDFNPADLSWHACIPANLYGGILEKFPKEKDLITAKTVFEDNYAFVAYTKVSTEDQGFYTAFETYEVYDGRVSFNLFKQLHFSRWKRFAEQAAKEETVTIFECAYMQNHVNELLFFRNMPEDEIRAYMKDLLQTVHVLNPSIFYLSQPDVRETIHWIGDTRVNSAGDKEWLERVISYIESCPYGIKHRLKGFEGLVSAMEHRKEVELSMLPQLAASAFVIESSDRNWEKSWEQVKQNLNKI